MPKCYFTTRRRSRVFQPRHPCDEARLIPDSSKQGPGEYNPKLCPRYHLDMPGSSAFMSAVPKGTDLRYRAGPGPGQYIAQTPLGANISASNAPRFSSSAQRGAWLRSEQVRDTLSVVVVAMPCFLKKIDALM